MYFILFFAHFCYILLARSVSTKNKQAPTRYCAGALPYVGQSKDVYKRIKQHFHGTVPKNVIFAEDYYLSNIENKEKLFEIKIIPCETKDELDKLERELIIEYDALNNGYNGTSGNN